jgi:hypothetical protein
LLVSGGRFADFDGDDWATDALAYLETCRLKSVPAALERSRLDTLFLVMPILWTGTLAQYVGRLHRDHDGKREVIVYDYVDRAVPVLTRMAAKREKGYETLGYVLES